MLTNPKETTDNRLEILGNRCRKVGCLRPKGTTAGKIVSLALLDWPLHKVSSRDGKAVLEKFRDILKRFRKSFDNKTAPTRYPLDPSELPEHWYGKGYDDGKPIACPFMLNIIHCVESSIPLRDTNAHAGRSAKPTKGGYPFMRCGSFDETATGVPSTSVADPYTMLGRAIAEHYPQIGQAVHEPWFQNAVQQQRPDVWRELMSSSLRKDNIHIRLMHKHLTNGEAGTPSVGSSDSLSTSAGQLQIELQSPAGAAAKGAATESLRGDVSDAKGAATAPLRGDVSDVLATIDKSSKTPKRKKDKTTTSMKKKKSVCHESNQNNEGDEDSQGRRENHDESNARDSHGRPRRKRRGEKDI